jgi:heterotetrameric sarcosine oxidase delta subunit
MAMMITCPNCGPRPVTEWRYGGEIPIVDPALDADAADIDRVWMRSNGEGEQRERWFHELGCRRWCTVVRDAVVDRVRSVE